MPIWVPVTPEPPEEVVTRLQQIDPHLNLKFVEYPRTEDVRDADRWWALVWEWPKDDKRYRLVESGAIGNTPYDILGYLPLDCDVHSAFPYVQNFLLGSRTRPEIGKMVNRIGEFNRDATRKAKNEIDERAGELIENNINPIMDGFGKSQPKVSQYQGKGK